MSSQPKPTVASDLKRSETSDEERIWGPYIRHGHTTLFASHPKLGKSTLLSHILRLTEKGGEVGYPVKAGTKSLVVTEESENMWFDRRESIGMPDTVSFLFRKDLWGKRWDYLCEDLLILTEENRYNLVVIDTFGYYAEIEDENDAGSIQIAVKLLSGVVEAGAAVFLIHHKRKASGNFGTGIRGSSAFVGAVDIVVEMDRVANQPRARSISCLSRFDSVDRLQITLSEDSTHYVSSSVTRAVLDILPLGPPGLTRKELVALWPPSMPLSETFLAGFMDRGAISGLWVRVSEGKKTLWRYHR